MPQAPAPKDIYKTAEVCKAADVAPYVLKYWLTEFSCLSVDKDKSPNRTFSAKEVAIIARIRQLLYDEGFTIAGAKKKIDAEIAAGAFESGRQTEKGRVRAGTGFRPRCRGSGAPAHSGSDAPEAPGSLRRSEKDRQGAAGHPQADPLRAGFGRRSRSHRSLSGSLPSRSPVGRVPGARGDPGLS